MAYTKKIWKDYPDATTPILASDMNNIEDGLEALDIAYSGLLNFFYPVGTIYETTSTNLDTTTKMNAHFGGTWEKYGNGRVTVCQTSTSSNFNTIGKTGGSETHTLTIDEMPSHNHRIRSDIELGGYDAAAKITSGTAYVSSSSGIAFKTGGGQAHNNLQPYIVVYRYRRIT